MFMRGWSPQNSVPNSVSGTPAVADKKSAEAPPMSDEEMQAKIQYMISLQVAAQEQDDYQPSTIDADRDSNEKLPPPPPPITVPGSVAGAHITPAAAAEAEAAAASLAAAATGKPPRMDHQKPPVVPKSSERSSSVVGRSIMGSFPYSSQDYGAALSSSTREKAATVTAGATTGSGDGVGQGHLYFPGEYPSSGTATQQPLQQPLEEQHPMLDGSTIPHYYGGAAIDSATMVDQGATAVLDDHHHNASNIDDPDYIDKPSSHHHHHHRSRRVCCCLGPRLAKCCRYWKNAEALHRSFCYGAIDGMLTGSGIVATFLGMGLLKASDSTAMHLWVVAFSLAACTSDAICMALGHVWSTLVLTQSSANERRTERLSFEQNRADAKGKLVDMLLSRGMLKIDAMSIADTLEGYPDIFVSALVGDSGYTLGEESLASSSTRSGSSSGQLGLGYQQQAFNPEETHFSPLLRRRRSYGQFSNEEELDPEAASVKVALGESRKEGLIMMLSFALFSVIPALLFMWLATVMNVSTKHRASGGTSVTSIAVSLTSIIMLLLGIWKSRFFDSNWVIFGMETVAVLWLCTLSAYFIGFSLSMCLPGLHGTTLTLDGQ